MTTSNDRLDRIEAAIEKLSEDLAQMRAGQTRIAENQTRIAENQTRMAEDQTRMAEDQTRMAEDQNQGRKWEDRTWDVIKWVGGISAALSISAAIALVGLVIRLSLAGQ
jgi:hypothetical protein